MSKPDLVAEHRALLAEQAELRKLCLDEWMTMSYQLTQRRGERLLAIEKRLLVIERTKAWKSRGHD